MYTTQKFINDPGNSILWVFDIDPFVPAYLYMDTEINMNIFVICSEVITELLCPIQCNDLLV